MTAMFARRRRVVPATRSVNDTFASPSGTRCVSRTRARTPRTRRERQRGAVPEAAEAVMGTEDLKVHNKDRALFERIDATLAAYDAARDEQSVPTYLQDYAAELDRWHADTVAARRRAS